MQPLEQKLEELKEIIRKIEEIRRAETKKIQEDIDKLDTAIEHQKNQIRNLRNEG